MWLYGWELLILGHYTATFSDFMHCGSRDKTFLICHVISKDHVLRGLCDFMCDFKFSDHKPCGSRAITYLICHMSLQDHLIKGSKDIMKGNSSMYVTLASFVAVAIAVVEI